MSNSSQVKLIYKKQSAFGTVADDSTAWSWAPATPNYQVLRFASESLKQQTETTDSEEIDSTSQVVQVFRNGVTAPGDIVGEWSYDTYEELILSAMGANAFTTLFTPLDNDVSVTNGTTIASAGSGFSASAGATYIMLYGSWANGTNNGAIHRVGAGPTTSTLVLDTGGNALTAETPAAAGKKFTQGTQVVNSTNLDYYSIERQDIDAGTFAMYLDMAVNRMRISGDRSGGPVQISFEFLGSAEQLVSAARPTSTADGSANAADSDVAFTMAENLSIAMFGNNHVKIRRFDMETNRNLRGNTVGGTLGLHAIKAGEFECTGTFTLFFENDTIANSYLNFSDADLTFGFTDANDQAYVFRVQTAKITDCQNITPGKNTDVELVFQFRAKVGGAAAKMLRFIKFITSV